MDREQLMAQLNALSDEELLAITSPHTEDDEPRVRPQAVMPDGSTISADSAEELNRILTAKLAEYREREIEPAPQPVDPKEPKVRKWEYKTFQELFVNDPRAGMEYLEEVQTGISGGYTKLVPLLVNALGTLSTKVEELEAQDFLNTTPEYQPSVANRKVLDQIIIDRGWKVNSTSLADAFDIAKARGLIEGAESPRTRTAPEPAWAPPRTRNSRGMGTEEEVATTAEVISRAEEMPIKDLQRLLLAAGVIKGEHV